MKAFFITLLILNYIVLVYCQFKLLRIYMQLIKSKERLNFIEKQYICFKSVSEYKKKQPEMVKKFNVFRVFVVAFFITLFMLVAFIYTSESF